MNFIESRKFIARKTHGLIMQTIKKASKYVCAINNIGLIFYFTSSAITNTHSDILNKQIRLENRIQKSISNIFSRPRSLHVKKIY